MLIFGLFIVILSNFKKIFCVENLIEITDGSFSNVIHSTDYVACLFYESFHQYVDK